MLIGQENSSLPTTPLKATIVERERCKSTRRQEWPLLPSYLPTFCNYIFTVESVISIKCELHSFPIDFFCTSLQFCRNLIFVKLKQFFCAWKISGKLKTTEA